MFLASVTWNSMRRHNGAVWLVAWIIVSSELVMQASYLFCRLHVGDDCQVVHHMIQTSQQLSCGCKFEARSDILIFYVAVLRFAIDSWAGRERWSENVPGFLCAAAFSPFPTNLCETPL